MAKIHDISRVFVHACLDGRDTPPQSAVPYMTALQEAMQRQGIGAVASVMGRYYGMDRDQRWERTEKPIKLWCMGTGVTPLMP